jgi:hypothetical protein
MVNVTYLVPTFWKVNCSTCPVPRANEPPLGGSSAQEYVHGAAPQLDPLASNATDCPVTGDAGLTVNDAAGAGAATRAVAVELADVEPPEFVAVTMVRIVSPTSADARV